MRRAGTIPAVLYGHKEESVSLAVPGDQLAAALRHHSRVVQLAGDVNEQALIRELQWDTFGAVVLHVDFTRVSADERVEVTVAIELRGEAPGTKEGGVVSHQLHEVEIECPAIAIPDALQVNINHLGLDQEIRLRDLTLPEGVKLLADEDSVVVECHVPAAIDLEAPSEAAPGEPEVIGRKAEDEEEE